MPRPRVSRSCGNCRAIKRRCDQQRPHCGQCTRLREKCPGYRNPWELIFRDQTDQTIQRFQKRELKYTAAGVVPHISPSPHTLNPCPNMEQVGVNYFLHHFVTGDHRASRGYLNYVPAALGARDNHPTLVVSLAAVGLVALANSTHQPELVRHARVKYAEAIRSVNTALASPTESVKDSTLMAVISLGVFEHFSQFDSWTRHVQGAAALMVLRGKDQFSSSHGHNSPVAILLFNQVRADMVVACMHSNRPFPEDMRALQEEASKHVDASSAFWRLGVLATQCVDFLWRVTESTGPNKTLWRDLLDAALVLQHDFQAVMGLLAVREPYVTIVPTTQQGVTARMADPDLIYNGRADLYSTSWTIKVWNNARNLQMIVSEIICYLVRKLLAMDSAAPVNTCAARSQYQLLLHETLGILFRLGEDILATVPQVLGIISSPSEPDPFVNTNAASLGVSVSGGYLLTWCLYMVGKSPATANQARKWIIRCFRNIVQGSGIGMGLPLLEEIVRIDRLAG
ncbi:Zn(II)2Cys6 transcription factor [Aspergillus homomorphus CBS 101889]|uniref:Zn(2)-C6 fungal-type domain-containing protein n=1 Tax=Aspergillus homomorphus (strain CBS 101889) TaxID=1450537 RepID=A0A395HZR9_ASPHC|nr:hypothetical protein BO97DRAFT_450157 [Aspergillus homomorphus CBS 101889]RAL13442.1 hypothetical protein BO97DRAFT_450157 [Aspergillus homomorphus CBS 101889]